MPIEDDFFLTNLELRESTPTGEMAAGLSHSSMKGMVLLTVLELAARGEPCGAVTVLHDAGDTGARYKALASDLAERGWAVALPDLRGHGLTEGPRGHSNGLKEVCRDIQEIQDHLAYRMPEEPKVLVGVGLGANYAATYALEHPGILSGLVLIGPLHEPRFQRPVPPKGLAKFFKKITPESEGSTGFGPDDLTSAAAQATAWSADEQTHGIITQRAIDEAERSAREHLPRVAEAGIPVLVIHGEDDPLSDRGASEAMAGGAVEVRVVEGKHHPLHDRGSAKIRSGLVDWISALT